MTAQQPDILQNEFDAIHFEGLHFYGVQINHPRTEAHKPYLLPSRPLPPTNTSLTTDLWRGYRKIYRLTASGRLTFSGYQYQTPSGPVIREANETLTGNFWLEMRPDFFERSMYVPFRNGILEQDRDQWIIDPGMLNWW